MKQDGLNWNSMCDCYACDIARVTNTFCLVWNNVDESGAKADTARIKERVMSFILFVGKGLKNTFYGFTLSKCWRNLLIFSWQKHGQNWININPTDVANCSSHCSELKHPQISLTRLTALIHSKCWHGKKKKKKRETVFVQVRIYWSKRFVFYWAAVLGGLLIKKIIMYYQNVL